MQEKTKELIISNLPLFKELTKKFRTFYTGDIDLLKIVYFILQFRDHEAIEVVIKLLKNISFLDSNKINYLLKKSFEKIPEDLRKKAAIFPLGSSQDSCAVICYSIFKEIFKNESEVLNNKYEISELGELIEEGAKAIIFIDDNITSGTQLYDFFTELFIGKDQAELVKKPLTEVQKEKLRGIPIYVCYAIRLTQNCETKIQQIKDDFKVKLTVTHGVYDDYNYLDYSSNLFDSKADSDFAKKMIEKISIPLYNDKKWEPDVLYNRLLGYGNLGKLTVFYYNVPKSLIPVFWKSGNIQGIPWIPLFPERSESKKLNEQEIPYDGLIIEVAKMLISNQEMKRSPELSWIFISEKNEQLENGIYNLDLPNNKTLKDKLFSKINEIVLEIEENQIEQWVPTLTTSSYRNLYSDYTEGEFFNSSINEESYNLYKEHINKYNSILRDCYSNFKEYLKIVASQNKISLIIFNEGNKAATNLRVNFSYSSKDILFLTQDSKLERPYVFYPKPLSVDDFKLNEPVFNYDDIYTPYIKDIFVDGKNYVSDEDLKYFKLIQKINHKDYKKVNLNFIILNQNVEEIKIDYEIFYDESPESILEGELILKIKKIDYSEEKFMNLYNEIHEFNKLSNYLKD